MNQPQHTPAEAVQYWYDAATERREERDQLRAVVARVRQLHDRLAEEGPLASPDDEITRGAAAKRIAAALDGESAAQPSADRAALRERITEALWPLTDWDGDRSNAEAAVDAVLAVLPEPDPAVAAERDSLGHETDRLRKDWVEMRTRAERAEADRAVVLRKFLSQLNERLLGCCEECNACAAIARDLAAEIAEEDQEQRRPAGEQPAQNEARQNGVQL